MSRWKTHPQESHALADLRLSTPARVGIGRAGLRPGTQSWLKFRQDHAMAKDAVDSEFSESLLGYVREQNFELVQTKATNKLDFIAYPPKGKQTDSNTLDKLKATCPSNLDVQIVI